MNYNEKYAKSFKYLLMFGKSVRPGEEVSASVESKDDILLAIKKAYVDMTPRTFVSKDPEHKIELDYSSKMNLFEALADRFAAYIKNGAENFDDWHEEICEFFIGELRKILDAAGKDPGQATYGKAQKIVNMTFKYLYCFDNAEKYVTRFEPCHMALDSYILNWYIKKYNESAGGNERLSKYGRNCLPSWSNLDHDQYMEIQKNIKGYCGNTPRIEKEFLIWYGEKEGE